MWFQGLPSVPLNSYFLGGHVFDVNMMPFEVTCGHYGVLFQNSCFTLLGVKKKSEEKSQPASQDKSIVCSAAPCAMGEDLGVSDLD